MGKIIDAQNFKEDRRGELFSNLRKLKDEDWPAPNMDIPMTPEAREKQANDICEAFCRSNRAWDEKMKRKRPLWGK